MTEPAPTLDTLLTVDTGMPTVILPTETTVSQTALAAHPFLWALDAYLFAGPEARKATVHYAEARGVNGLDVYVYKIMATVEGVMTLHRVL